jgi:biopolymer transport protein ExbB
MEGTSLLDMIVYSIKVSPAFDILILISVVTLALGLERYLYYRKTKVDVPTFLEKIRLLYRERKPSEVVRYTRNMHGPIPAIYYTAFANLNLPFDELTKAVAIAMETEALKLEKFTSVLGTFSNISPFIGLAGTTWGIIVAFRDIALAGSGGASVVAAGIAEALVATAAGIVVAIISTIFYNYSLRKIRVIMADTRVARDFLTQFIQPRG